MTSNRAQAVPATTTRNRPVRTIAVAILGAAVVNAGIFLAFGVAGATFENTRMPQPVGLPAVLFVTVVPLLIGLSAAALLSRRWPGLVTAGQVVGPALALLTIALPAVSGFDTLSFIALALMHVVVAVAVFLGLTALKR
jgi:uncharacterized membrane protein YhaH (DUF805 family)